MSPSFSLSRTGALFGCAILGFASVPVCAQNYILTDTTIDGSSPIIGSIIVGQDSTGTVNTSPSVHILTGAMVNYVDGYNHSIVHLADSSVNDVYFHDSSTLDVFGGTLRNHIYSYDNSTIDMSGGHLALDLDGFDNSHVNVTGGTIGQNMQAHGSSVFHFYGGSVARGSVFDDTSDVTISGGAFGQNVGVNFFVAGSSVLTLIGHDLSLTDVGEFMGFGEEFALGGRLADGTDLTGYTLVKETGFAGNVTLQETPEPGSLALSAGLSVSGAVLLRRRKKAAKAA